MTKYALLPCCNWDDAEDLALTCMTAFWEEPWFRGMFEIDLDEVIDRGILSMRHGLTESRDTWRHQHVVTDKGESVGYARWRLVRLPADTWEEAKASAITELEKATVDEEFRRAPKPYPAEYYEGVRKPAILLEGQAEPQGPYISLAVLCVRPEHQGMGIGKMLVRSGIKIADQLGVPILVRSEGFGGKHMFDGLGFELKHCYSKNLKEWGVDARYNAEIMIRQPTT